MSAEIIQFPAPAKTSVAPQPIITIARYRTVPRQPPYKTAASIVDGVAGWAVEALNHPGGGIGVLGFHRDEAVAWQEAVAEASNNGWRAERSRRLAVASARQTVAGGHA